MTAGASPAEDTRALQLWSALALQQAGVDGRAAALYDGLQSALHELVGFKLLTVLRLRPPHLVRLHSSDPHTYSAGGRKDITHDPWLRTMLANGVPVISADEAAVRPRFVDHEAIFAMGCGAVLNVPVTCQAGPLGSLNLLHSAQWFKPRHIALVHPFAALLAVAWLAEDRHGSGTGTAGSL